MRLRAWSLFGCASVGVFACSDPSRTFRHVGGASGSAGSLSAGSSGRAPDSSGKAGGSSGAGGSSSGNAGSSSNLGGGPSSLGGSSSGSAGRGDAGAATRGGSSNGGSPGSDVGGGAPAGDGGMGGENPVDPCSPNPCTHGTCESDGTSYSCTCDTGYRGDSCAINIDDCAGNPCTHGTCIDGVASYQCDCGNTGYAGKLCDTLIQNCAQTPCSNGGVCMDLDASRTCDCTGTGATGTSCEVDIDECATNPCAHGTCVNGKNQYTCNCGSTGYKGTNCDVDIDECDSHPCDPLTTCNNSSGSFSCSSCPPGYSGSGLKGCNNIDDCAGNPCKNGGTCTDGVNAFTCACPSPWSGSTCQNATLSIDMSARGFYADANWFPPSTGNTETGWSGDFGYASYLIFAIPSFTGTVSGVTLRLEHVNYDSPDPSEIVLVSDVTTPVATLLSNTSANQTIYQDLAGGTQYGSLTGWTASTVGTVRSFSLSGALTAVSNARGTSFAIGVSLSSLSKSTVPETVSFSQNTETRVNQLQVVVTP